jgi:topoisomerase IA-like protein
MGFWIIGTDHLMRRGNVMADITRADASTTIREDTVRNMHNTTQKMHSTQKATMADRAAKQTAAQASLAKCKDSK